MTRSSSTLLKKNDREGGDNQEDPKLYDEDRSASTATKVSTLTR